jgi:hypothetical protein
MLLNNPHFHLPYKKATIPIKYREGSFLHELDAKFAT